MLNITDFQEVNQVYKDYLVDTERLYKYKPAFDYDNPQSVFSPLNSHDIALEPIRQLMLHIRNNHSYFNDSEYWIVDIANAEDIVFSNLDKSTNMYVMNIRLGNTIYHFESYALIDRISIASVNGKPLTLNDYINLFNNLHIKKAFNN